MNSICRWQEATSGRHVQLSLLNPIRMEGNNIFDRFSVMLELN
jgi:hypothetical protein